MKHWSEDESALNRSQPILGGRTSSVTHFPGCTMSADLIKGIAVEVAESRTPADRPEEG